MFSKNSVIRSIAVISILALMAVVVLPGCTFIGKAELPPETTTQDMFADDAFGVVAQRPPEMGFSK